jgi:xanthine dehydrogenase/oxidase
MLIFLYSLMEQNSANSLEEIGRILDGNICRCTGYRPIFEAFQSMSPEARPELKKKLADIEDLVSKKRGSTCQKTRKPCAGSCSTKNKEPGTMQFIKLMDGEWIKPKTVEELMALLDNVQPGTKYRLVAGNTGVGKWT